MVTPKSLAQIFILRPDVQAKCEEMATHGSSADRIMIYLSSMGLTISRGPVGTWLREFRDTSEREDSSS